MLKKTVLVFVVALLLLALPAMAQDTAAGGAGASSRVRWGAIAAAFLLGIAAAAGAIRTMTIIGLALIESLVLYALLIAFLIRNL